MQEENLVKNYMVFYSKKKNKKMKLLAKPELKNIMGGQIQACSATANCSDGTTKSCSGFSVGTQGGCDATDAGYGGTGGNGVVTCCQWNGSGFQDNSFSC